MSDLIEGHNGPWEVILGLEVHAQVISKAKLFSGAATNFVVLREGKVYFEGTPPELADTRDAYLRRFLL